MCMIKTTILKNGKRVPLRKHQREAIKAVTAEFNSGSDRATIVHCCRSGKSLTSVSLHKEIKSKATIVFLPSLSLLTQTYKDWMKNCSRARILLVGSDADAPEVENTTKSKKIKEFLENANGRESVIFSTYQSCKKVCKATSSMEDFTFDLMICDEAHQSAGINLKKGVVHSDDCIPSSKRLYMTATPKLLSEAVKQRVLADAKMHCMSDEDIFGKQVHLYSFKDGIEDEMLSDYEIVSLGCLDKSKANAINDEEDSKHNEIKETAKLHALKKALKTRSVTHCVSFHSNVSKALFFTKHFNLRGWKVFHINGELNMEEREIILKKFAKAKKALLTNCKCLQEGINLIECDSVFFSDCKRGAVDVIQASSRPLTKDPKKPKGFKNAIFIPTLHTSSDSMTKVCATSSFKTLIQLIKHMRMHDERIESFLHHASSRVGTNEPLDPDPIIKVDGFEGLVDDIYAEIIPMDLRQNQGGKIVRTRRAGWTAQDIDRAFAQAKGSRVGAMRILQVSESFIKSRFKEYPWLAKKWNRNYNIKSLEEISFALEVCKGNMVHAARYLGCSREQIRKANVDNPELAKRWERKDIFSDSKILKLLNDGLDKGLSVAEAKKATAKTLKIKVISLADRCRKGHKNGDERFSKFVRKSVPSEAEVMALFEKHGTAPAIAEATGVPYSTIKNYWDRYPKVKAKFPNNYNWKSKK